MSRKELWRKQCWPSICQPATPGRPSRRSLWGCATCRVRRKEKHPDTLALIV